MFFENIVFRKVSKGFLATVAKILKKASIARHKIVLEGDKDYTIVEMENGAKRLIYPNKNYNNYDRTKVMVNGKFDRVENRINFPAQPFKLVLENGQTVANLGKKEISDRAIGFLVKVAPGGIAVADIFTK